MGFDCKMLADSIAPNGVRLCTQQVTFPRFILAETNTHRVFSRNSASSRAMPVEKNIARMLLDMFVPAAFGSNKKGMQAGDVLIEEEQLRARSLWTAAAGQMASLAEELARVGVHKQWANRLIEFATWHTAIITSSRWANWDALRDNPQASPEIQVMARMMKESRAASTPKKLDVGQWHLPLVFNEDLVFLWEDGEPNDGPACLRWSDFVKISVARCARVSYLTHDGKRDVEADLALYDRLVSSGHMSPLEHAAKVASAEEIEEHALYKRVLVDMGDGLVRGTFKAVSIGNLDVPWLQHRKMIPGEDVFVPKGA